MFSFNEIQAGIYHVNFEDHIELVAHFLRYQEYYECPKHSGVNFELMDYIKWYVRKTKAAIPENGNDFTYFEDWSGFNVPASTVIECYEKIPDKNHHDGFLFNLAKLALEKPKSGKAYLIGTSSERPSTIDHELCHGMYYVDFSYRLKVASLLEGLMQKGKYYSFKDTLTKMGYAIHVIEDEMNAYLATGLSLDLKDLGIITEDDRKPFIELFEQFRS
jgi:hypothetical protein